MGLVFPDLQIDCAGRNLQRNKGAIYCRIHVRRIEVSKTRDGLVRERAQNLHDTDQSGCGFGMANARFCCTDDKRS